MDEIIVYTSVFNDYDVLQPTIYSDVRHICFTDYPQDVTGWEEIVVKPQLRHPKRESAMYLALSHLLLPECKFSIFHGGNGELKVHPTTLVDLLENDIALFAHPLRDCVYDEADAVLELGKVEADHDTVKAQMAYYGMQGYPERNGLSASALMVRKHSEDVKQFNERLWAVMCAYTARDQLAIDFVKWELGLQSTIIPGGKAEHGRLGENDYIVTHRHR